jgi:hypothetical protein
VAVARVGICCGGKATERQSLITREFSEKASVGWELTPEGFSKMGSHLGQTVVVLVFYVRTSLGERMAPEQRERANARARERRRRDPTKRRAVEARYRKRKADRLWGFAPP